MILLPSETPLSDEQDGTCTTGLTKELMAIPLEAKSRSAEKEIQQCPKSQLCLVESKGARSHMRSTEGPVSALRKSCQVLVPVILSRSQMFCLQADHFARSICNMGFWGIANHV